MWSRLSQGFGFSWLIDGQPSNGPIHRVGLIDVDEHELKGRCVVINVSQFMKPCEKGGSGGRKSRHNALVLGPVKEGVEGFSLGSCARFHTKPVDQGVGARRTKRRKRQGVAQAAVGPQVGDGFFNLVVVRVELGQRSVGCQGFIV